MAYRKAFAMQKQWVVEVAKCISEWANGDRDVNGGIHAQLAELTNEPMNEGVSESIVNK